MDSGTSSSTSDQVVYLAAVGAVCAVLDTLYGVMATVAFFEWRSSYGVALGVALLSCLPAYALDYVSQSRFVIVLPLVFVFRYVLEVFAVHPAAVFTPWAGNLLFIAALGFLQGSKKRRADQKAAPVG